MALRSVQFPQINKFVTPCVVELAVRLGVILPNDDDSCIYPWKRARALGLQIGKD